MKWIMITSPDFLLGEDVFIDRLFYQGLDLLHIRKPGASYESYKQLILKIPREWHNRIVVHEHFALAQEYGLFGIHQNHRCLSVPDNYKGSVSASCHSMEEVAHCKVSKDYVFLSPIFDSISKVGYHAAFAPDLLNRAAEEKIIDRKVIALGGINAENIELVKQWNFGGVALLGDIWCRMLDPHVDLYLKKIRNLLIPIGY